jgi:hypothetical protein
MGRDHDLSVTMDRQDFQSLAMRHHDGSKTSIPLHTRTVTSPMANLV